MWWFLIAMKDQYLIMSNKLIGKPSYHKLEYSYSCVMVYFKSKSSWVIATHHQPVNLILDTCVSVRRTKFQVLKNPKTYCCNCWHFFKDCLGLPGSYALSPLWLRCATQIMDCPVDTAPVLDAIHMRPAIPRSPLYHERSL